LGVLGLVGTDVTGNRSRVGSISEKYMAMPLALTTIFFAIFRKL
jgi:hypothetical protein